MYDLARVGDVDGNYVCTAVGDGWSSWRPVALPVARAAPANPSEWLAKVLEHCERATETSVATMRALGKSSSKIRKAVER